MNGPHPAVRPLELAVIGTGPRGISVLERLAVRLREHSGERPVRIYAVDRVEVGAGRIWRTDQPDWFTMNTVIGQVTIFSGDSDDGPARPGAGPSLGEWLADGAPADIAPLGPNDYAPRVVYGRYLRYVWDTVIAHLPSWVEVVPVRASVTEIRPRPCGGYALFFDAAPHLVEVDKVVLTTGHPQNQPDEVERTLLDFVDSHPPTRYLCGDSAADLDLSLDTVRPGAGIGIRGMGLSFYDVMLTLTIGRGGRFEEGPEGLRYVPSGDEPHIITGSRSGLPIPARGRNQKDPNRSHRSLFLTHDALTAARDRRTATTGSDRLDFSEDVLPLLRQEVQHVYYTTHVRVKSGAEAAEEFGARFAEALRSGGDGAEVLRDAGVDDIQPLDLDALARPFTGEHFANPEQWRQRLLGVIRADLAQAELGNVDGPLKAALDVLRDIRTMVREAVDYGGLTPRSHRDDFLGRYVPVNALLSAGPPQQRVEQLLALIEADVVEVVGPASVFEPDPASGRFRVHSPQVEGSARLVEVMVDARIPSPRLHRDTSPLIRQLVADRMITEYVVVDEQSRQAFHTGGVAVTKAPFHVVDADGEPQTDLYALGIPTEHTRWFTQVGSSRPGMKTLFSRDADAVAVDVCAALSEFEVERLVPAAVPSGRTR